MLKVLSSLGMVVLHTLIIYVFLIVALRLVGRRQTAQLAAMELVIIAVLGSGVETALIAGDTSLLAGLVSAATLMVCNFALSFAINRWVWLRRALMGRAVPLVYKGQFLERRMRQVGLSEEDVRQGIRERGYDDIARVRLAMMEVDGAISVVPEPKQDGKS